MFSIELLPAITEEGRAQLLQTAANLHALNPDYFFVTSGVSGVAAAETVTTSAFLQEKYKINVVPHFSLENKTKAEIISLLDHYLQLGMKHLFVLRGNSKASGDFQYANQLVTFIRNHIGHEMHITVAAYPEKHPDSKTLEDDLYYFQQKVAAGADSVITQYFYDIDVYARLLENCQRLNINIPIVPGVLPIVNGAQILRFSSLYGIQIPTKIRYNLERFSEDKAAILEYGIEIVSDLCQRLLHEGAPQLHFFTLNQSESILRIINEIK